ncbi:MAG: GNAT family N-acetyltransferase [Ilumatobacter sp.]|uniref:GNAT family N-acetyltransferase n=1 Tax=Ilumatobacter sp. TaxID=1967498 RepID=UPI002611A792|nr:GNAT family N-acetyltransferase [Ilumatobacter sp.]MDJ0769516.1 GNAT family N-acetyltransferase [Ilumatobacter sp.]
MQLMQTYFRDAVRGDLRAIATILREADASGDVEDHDGIDRYREALDEIDRSDGNYVLVAEYDGQITAVIQMVAFRRLHHQGDRCAEIVAMHVAEAFRTTGIGGMLVDHAVARAHDLGCRRLQVLSGTSRTDEHPFWERNGFVRLDRGYVRTLG